MTLNLTRRATLRALASISAIGGATATLAASRLTTPETWQKLPAVTPESTEAALERLFALHEEASELMAVYEQQWGGNWELRVRAPDADHPVMYYNIRGRDTAYEYELARTEFIEAAKALHPDVTDWRIMDDPGSPRLATMFLIVGHLPEAVRS